MAPSRVGSPIPQEVSDELRRVVERWHQLPLGHALSRMPSVQASVQALADRVAGSRGGPSRHVPDLGPAVVMDQLTVMVFDLFQAQPGTDPAAVAEQLIKLRADLARR